MITRPNRRSADIMRASMPPAIIAIGTMLLLRFPPAQHSFYPRCPIHELFHLQCPGCGATRAIAALLHGHLTEAMNLNALITVLLPLAAAYGIFGYCRLLQRKPLRWPQPPPAVIFAALGFAAAFTVIRNLPLHSY